MKVAITGGIGSGKSTLCKILQQMGYVVISSDAVCAELYRDIDFCRYIGVALGLDFDGSLESRRRLSDVVFQNKVKLQQLNAIVHPSVYREIERKLSREKGLCFVEVPLLFESGGEGNFDHVVIVMRDEKLRVQATINRDGVTENDVINRIKNQVDYEKIDKTAHTVLINDGSIEELQSKAVALVKTLSNKAI